MSLSSLPPPPSLGLAAFFAEKIKLNALSRETRQGRIFWVKRRRPTARLVVACANAFFRLAENPVRAIGKPHEWQGWELHCLEFLHGREFAASAEGERAVAAEEMPGISLSDCLDRKALEPAHAAAAGCELRRAHQAFSPFFDARWSHGDPHSGNFLYDSRSARARLIDFEVRHLRTIPEADRHADDLLVFLQDLIGRVSAERVTPLAEAFLKAYGSLKTIKRLAGRLYVAPGPASRLWWAVRTTYLPAMELQARLATLRRVAGTVAGGAAVSPVRV